MKVEAQVSNKELSEKLCKLGVKQESLWWWLDLEINDRYALRLTKEIYAIKGCSAFTVAELGEMLPNCAYTLKCSDNKTWLWGTDIFKRYEAEWSDNFDKVKEDYADTEANARAKMLIWLIEQGKVKV